MPDEPDDDELLVVFEESVRAASGAASGVVIGSVAGSLPTHATKRNNVPTAAVLRRR